MARRPGCVIVKSELFRAQFCDFWLPPAMGTSVAAAAGRANYLDVAATDPAHECAVPSACHRGFLPAAHRPGGVRGLRRRVSYATHLGEDSAQEPVAEPGDRKASIRSISVASIPMPIIFIWCHSLAASSNGRKSQESQAVALHRDVRAAFVFHHGPSGQLRTVDGQPLPDGIILARASACVPKTCFGPETGSRRATRRLRVGPTADREDVCAAAADIIMTANAAVAVAVQAADWRATAI